MLALLSLKEVIAVAAYKDKKKKTWIAKFKYQDWQGKTKWITKRGFQNKRDAVEFEYNFKLQKSGDPDMLFKDFVDKYREEVYPRIKVSTTMTKDNIINGRILPYFGEKKLNEISKTDIIAWQNEMIAYRDEKGKPFAKSYLKTLHNQISAILNHAVKFYGLKENVASKVGNMGSENEVRINFWTRDEYESFRQEAMEYPLFYYCFEVLYWTGIREGELLALTSEDIDFEAKEISITKTYHKINGKDMITTPKTAKSVRTVTIPDFLVEELRDYIDMNYGLRPQDRIFTITKTALNRKLKQIAAKAGVKTIRVHDLRHSHVSLLINMGYSAVAIGDRVGHDALQVTFRYAHLFPQVQQDMAAKLDSMGRK